MNGGYIIVDCTGLELTAQSKLTISGIYKQVDAAYKTGKPVLAVNCTFEDDIMSPVYVMVNPRSNGNYIATASTLQITIDEDDGVTIVSFV